MDNEKTVETTTETTKVVNKRHMGLKAKNIISNTLIYIVLGIMAVIWLVPFIFIILQSFRVESTEMVGYVIPHKFCFDNYIISYFKKIL